MLPRPAAVKRHMDVFSRTFLPAAAEAGVAIPTVSRHMPIFRRCVEPDDSTVLVTRCYARTPRWPASSCCCSPTAGWW